MLLLKEDLTTSLYSTWTWVTLVCLYECAFLRRAVVGKYLHFCARQYLIKTDHASRACLSACCQLSRGICTFLRHSGRACSEPRPFRRIVWRHESIPVQRVACKTPVMAPRVCAITWPARINAHPTLFQRIKTQAGSCTAKHPIASQRHIAAPSSSSGSHTPRQRAIA